MTLTEAREIVKNLRNETLTVNRIDYAEAKGFIEGHKAALESKVLSELRYAVERALTLKPDMPNREWFESVIEDFDKFKEAQK